MSARLTGLWIVVMVGEHRQRAYGPMSEDEALRLCRLIWDRAEVCGQVASVSLYRHSSPP